MYIYICSYIVKIRMQNIRRSISFAIPLSLSLSFFSLAIYTCRVSSQPCDDQGGIPHVIYTPKAPEGGAGGTIGHLDVRDPVAKGAIRIWNNPIMKSAVIHMYYIYKSMWVNHSTTQGVEIEWQLTSEKCLVIFCKKYMRMMKFYASWTWNMFSLRWTSATKQNSMSNWECWWISRVSWLCWLVF